MEILSSFDFVDGKPQGDYVKTIKSAITGKEGGLAMKFAAHVIKEAATEGKEKAFALEMGFDEN